MKVEQALRKEIVEDVGAIRAYCGHIKFEMNSTVERGENPHLFLKRTVRQKTGQPEVEIVFLGEHHDEHHDYYVKDPAKWSSFGYIVVTPEKACELGRRLISLGSPKPELERFMTCIIYLGNRRPTKRSRTGKRKPLE